MNDFLEQAKKISHVTANLYSHLVGTSDLLKSWGARKALCNAGLYHSTYSTEGFKPRLINHRSELKEIIGEEAEEIVYYFSACDRNLFYEQLKYRNRETNSLEEISDQLKTDLLELTLANELEILISNKNLVSIYKKRGWVAIFDKFEPFVSNNAFRKYKDVFV